MAEIGPDYEGAWMCGNRPERDENGIGNVCPPEGCPKGYCALDAGWRPGEPSPRAVTHPCDPHGGPRAPTADEMEKALRIWLRAMHIGRSEPLFIARDHSLRLLNLRSEADA